MTRSGTTNADTPLRYVDDVALDLVESASVPEPATLSLLGLGLAGAAVRRFKEASVGCKTWLQRPAISPAFDFFLNSLSGLSHV